MNNQPEPTDGALAHVPQIAAPDEAPPPAVPTTCPACLQRTDGIAHPIRLAEACDHGTTPNRTFGETLRVQHLADGRACVILESVGGAQVAVLVGPADVEALRLAMGRRSVAVQRWRAP